MQANVIVSRDVDADVECWPLCLYLPTLFAAITAGTHTSSWVWQLARVSGRILPKQESTLYDFRDSCTTKLPPFGGGVVPLLVPLHRQIERGFKGTQEMHAVIEKQNRASEAYGFHGVYGGVGQQHGVERWRVTTAPSGRRHGDTERIAASLAGDVTTGRVETITREMY